jgi:hypothetical protein
MIKPFPSDRIGRESMKKRKAETCVWEKFRGGFFGSYHIPSCDKNWRFYDVQEVCECGKKVEVKK